MNSATIASQENTRADRVKVAFQAVLTVQGETPAPACGV